MRSYRPTLIPGAVSSRMAQSHVRKPFLPRFRARLRQELANFKILTYRRLAPAGPAQINDSRMFMSMMAHHEVDSEAPTLVMESRQQSGSHPPRGNGRSESKGFFREFKNALLKYPFIAPLQGLITAIGGPVLISVLAPLLANPVLTVLAGIALTFPPVLTFAAGLKLTMSLRERRMGRSLQRNQVMQGIQPLPRNLPMPKVEQAEEARTEEPVRDSLIDIASYQITMPETRPDLMDTIVDPFSEYNAQRGYIRHIMANVIGHLRWGERPTLVGRIPGLTKEMEEIFRLGRVSIIKLNGGYMLMPTMGGETICGGGDWSELGFSRRPALEEQKAAYDVFNKWRKAQVELLDGDLAEAMSVADREMRDKNGVEIINPRSVGQAYFALELCKLVPSRVLGNSIKRINFGASRDGAARFGQYVEERQEVGLIRNPNEFDRYLMSALLIHELGHAVMAALRPEERGLFKQLHRQFRAHKAIFGVDFMMESRRGRIGYQGFFDEFFAENFMHFIVLGKEMLNGPNQKLRQRLYNAYAGLYGPQGFDALDHFEALNGYRI